MFMTHPCTAIQPKYNSKQVLGVTPPLARPHGGAGAGPGPAHPLSPSSDPHQPHHATTTVGLDLPRIHALQRDLVAFADSAFRLCCEGNDENGGRIDIACPPGTGTGTGTGTDPLPPTAAAAAWQAAVWALRRTASDLLLHLAALAPAAPLAADAPWAGHLTALDGLDEEVPKT